MKAKGREIIKLLLLCGCGLLIFYGIFHYFDVAWNGFAGDWFRDHFFGEEIGYTGIGGQAVGMDQIYWLPLKRLVFKALCAIVIFWLIVVFFVSRFYARAKVKKNVTRISREIQDYMQSDRQAQDIFEKEHAEIAAQISEIKSTMQQHEQMLKEEAARKNDLITYLAHDLKTPLTSVIGYLSLLDEAPDMPQKQKARYTGIALDKARRLETLINEFFDITRYNLQQVELEEETIDLSYMLVQMADEFYPLLSAHGNRINLRTEEGITIHGDSVRLARVFNNILKNAIAYSYRDTVIDVWTECTGRTESIEDTGNAEGQKEINNAESAEREVKIFFRNSGKTIPVRKLDSIFDKFFRLDEARTSNTGGAGLGLAIAKEIVTLHGGSITAASGNELTTFCVSLPAE